VQDRQGHDRRYALDTTKLRALGWHPQESFGEGLAETVRWYRTNEWWWRPIKERSPEFAAYYDAQYGKRARRADL
jgi:dTDP-glucose 4,6-dehydratase